MHFTGDFNESFLIPALEVSLFWLKLCLVNLSWKLKYRISSELSLWKERKDLTNLCFIRERKILPDWVTFFSDMSFQLKFTVNVALICTQRNL